MWNDFLDPAAKEREHEFERADHDHGGHADLPCENGSVVFGHAALFQRDKAWPENRERETDGRWSIEPKRHGGDIGVAGALAQFHRHPGVTKIAEQNRQRGAGQHALINDVSRELKSEDENAREERQNGDVVKHQAEEAVDVSRGEPFFVHVGWSYDVSFLNTTRASGQLTIDGDASRGVVSETSHKCN